MDFHLFTPATLSQTDSSAVNYTENGYETAGMPEYAIEFMTTIVSPVYTYTHIYYVYMYIHLIFSAASRVDTWKVVAIKSAT